MFSQKADAANLYGAYYNREIRDVNMRQFITCTWVLTDDLLLRGRSNGCLRGGSPGRSSRSLPVVCNLSWTSWDSNELGVRTRVMTIFFVDTSYVFEKKEKNPLSAELQNLNMCTINDCAFTAVQHDYTDNQWTVKKKADRKNPQIRTHERDLLKPLK